MIINVTKAIISESIKAEDILLDLDNVFFDFIGKISYGIYLIHPIIILISSKLIGEFNKSLLMNYLTVYGFVFIITIMLAYISFSYYEKPFIELKSKFAKIKSKA